MSAVKRRPLPKIPSLPDLPSLPGYRWQPDVTPVEDATQEPGMDRWGFPTTMLPEMPDRSKQYLALAYDYLNRDKRIAPAQYGEGTAPELVTFGGLLSFGFGYGGGYERTFEAQVPYLGGRRSIPGGTVSDFTVWVNGLVVAVYVESAFHDPAFVWVGRSKVEEERLVRLKVPTRTEIDRVAVMNHVDLGMPLEYGPDALVDLEFQWLMSV